MDSVERAAFHEQVPTDDPAQPEQNKRGLPTCLVRGVAVTATLLAIGCAAHAAVGLPEHTRIGESARGPSKHGEAASPLSMMQLHKIGRPGPFCGIAVDPTDAKKLHDSDLEAVVDKVDIDKAKRLWHYNRKGSTDLGADKAVYYPAVPNPGDTEHLPPAGADGVGRRVLGWLQPDTKQEDSAEKWSSMVRKPQEAARVWAADMLLAQSLGYTEFASPTIAADVCWLDFFLKGCEKVPKCVELLTHISFTHYRTDCNAYENDIENEHYRDEMGYIASFGRLREKYNERGFAIQGLMLTEIGCIPQKNDTTLKANAKTNAEMKYVGAMLRDTIVKVRQGDKLVIDSISNSPNSRWIGFHGPDAHVEGAEYKAGSCAWEDPGEDAVTGAASVRAIRSLTNFGIPSINQASKGLQDLFLTACSKIADPPEDGWAPPLNGAVG